MKILIANRHLKGLGGSETFTYTLIAELKKQGYEVEYFTLFKGIASEKIEALGVPFSKSADYDIAITGQVATVDALRRRKITCPIIQICHGNSSPGEQPNPKADGFIAVSEEVQKHLAKKGISAPVILNGIDCDRFKPRRKVRKTPKVVLGIVQDFNVSAIIEKAAEIAGLEYKLLNKYQDKVWDVEKEINKADMVVSLGRGAYEAMACARPVIVFDKGKHHPAQGDGYLLPENFDNVAKCNLNGRATEQRFTIEELASEMKKYNSDHGERLRQIAMEKLNIETQAKKIVEYCLNFKKEFTYPGTTDLVYILGTGSKWGNNEIRFSIRSFVKHFNDLRNVVVVGELPNFLRGVIHIPYPDKKNVNKDCRMMLKILAACKDSRVSENFILCTDDTVLLKDLNFEDFTGWHEGKIMYNAEKDHAEHKGPIRNGNIKKISRWFDFVYNTGNELKKRGLPENNYDRAHAPQPINKKEFIQVMNEWDMVNNNYTVSNIYNNSSKIFKGKNIKGKNIKVYGPPNAEDLKTLTEGKIYMNYSDPAINEEMKAFLHHRFPDSSAYEIFNTGIDRRKAAEEWLKNGRDYDIGVAIFSAHAPKNYRLIKWFQINKGRTIAERKLQKTMELWLR